MNWVVAVACVNWEEVISQPADFLSNIAGRTPPKWVVGVVAAEDEDQAYIFGEIAFSEGALGSNESSLDWYVAPLPDDFVIPPDVKVKCYTPEEVACFFAFRSKSRSG